MYKKLLAVTAASLTMMACSSSEPTQNDTTPQLAVCKPMQATNGTWKPAEISFETKQAAMLATASMDGDHKLSEVIDVQQQDATNTNYQINFAIETGELFTATVFKSPAGEFKLLAIQPKAVADECNTAETDS